MKTSVRLHLAFVALLLVTLGCAKRHIPMNATSEESSSDGKVAFEFIANASASGPELADHQEFVAPWPLESMAIPTYPGRPLGAKAPPSSVVVRIVIDPEGRVSSVKDSPLGVSTPGPFAADFRAAVETAIRSWRFQPGFIDQLADYEDGDGDGKPDATRLLERSPVPVIYDVRFDFEIVAGQGRVRSAAPR